LDTAQRISAATIDDEPAGSFDAPAGDSAGKGRSAKKLSSKNIDPKKHSTAEQHASKPTAAAAAKPTGMASGATVAGIVKETPHTPLVRQESVQGTTQPAAADMEHIRRANMRRSLDISRLIADIQQSMSAADLRRTRRLLEELAEVKGHNDPFVMKLRSYWYTRQGNLNRAAALLQEVLQYKPNDLEAGLNMAIIEIKTGQTRRADERLSRLRELYPEDTRIPELMEKLKS
jgi:thioredoxin-like negative regulator of GroEL